MELSPELLASLEQSTAAVPAASTLPPQLYTDEAWFAFERDAVWAREWVCVGRADDVAEPGDYRSVEVAGEPLLLVRTRDGDVAVISAVCQHRAMLVAEGDGHCSTFTCPYHHWIYGLDGRLLGAPAMGRTEGFAKAEHGLPALAVEQWQGFVFATLDPRPRPLAPTLAALDPFVAHFDLAGCAPGRRERYPGLPWNWKVMLENFNDGYHASRLHQGVHDFCPSELAAFVEADPGSNALIRTNGFLHPDGGFNATQRALLPIFPGLDAAERQRVTFALIPPSLMLGLAPDQVFWFLQRPRSAGSIDLEIGYLFDPGAVEEPLFADLFELSSVGVRAIVEQDIATTTGVQRGLASRFAGRGRYSWQEEIQVQLNRWLVDRYRRSLPGEGRTIGVAS